MSAAHQARYEQAVEMLEDLISEDPDYETSSEQDFIEEITEKYNKYLSPDEVERIGVLWRKYCC